ncbi:MAG: S-layer homology domain-containing protein [Ruminococcaceae bacterium]|nr:S-layer homology domain-containing protein [Oscillospiraceae bacterium]
MKKISIAVLLCVVLVMGTVTAFGEISFPDLPETHWAYDAVNQLVEEKTVSGTPEGTFEPNRLVTRAEFVRMIGKIDQKRESDFVDVSPEHWGYEYIMYSGVQGDENNCFYPDEPMTRGDVVTILWNRAGNPKGIAAPSVITDQAENKDAVAWIYMYGVMIGNDGINLRLEDGISRAEVASLIIRSRAIDVNAQPKEFSSMVSDDILKKIFNSTALFDREYDPNATVTNGELARAAVRLASEENKLTYSKFSVQIPFEHEYAKDLYVLGQNCLGEEVINEAFIDQPANNQDMIAALTFGMIKKAHSKIGYDTTSTCYADVGEMNKNIAYTCLTYANKKDVALYSNRNIRPGQTATMHDIALVLLQLDHLIGSQSAFTTAWNENEAIGVYDMSLEQNAKNYPETSQYFRCILEDMPSDIYAVQFFKMPAFAESAERNPVDIYHFSREFASMFVSRLNQETKRIHDELGIDVQFTYYSSLVTNNGNGFTCRVKLDVKNMNGKSGTYQELFKTTDGQDQTLADGTTLFIDVSLDYALSSDPSMPVIYGPAILKVK